MTPSSDPKPTVKPTIQRVYTLNEVMDLLHTILKMQNVFSDQLDDLITKVDEINLPVGSGMGVESYES
jgi:hypothetical protein